MKPIQEQNFYEIFELSPNATKEQLRQAFELAKLTYGTDSLATYSLFDSEERKEIIERIVLAYETLSSELHRKKYDQEILGLTVAESSVKGSDPPEAAESLPRTAEPSGKDDRDRALPDIDSLTGGKLRDYRERRKIPLQEIANKTRINITYFEYLEREQYASLPPTVYLRSYLIQYARMLGLDSERVADRIISLIGESKRRRSSGQSGATQHSL